MSTTDGTDLLTAALSYRAAGLSLVPANSETKRPHMKLLPRNLGTGRPEWNPFRERIASEQELRGWCAKTDALAVLGGKISGGLLVIDFDVMGFYEAWLSEVGELADGLPAQKTGRGMQVYMRCPSPGANQPLAWVPDDSKESGRMAAIETRGEGGYAVVAPSRHPTGIYYQVVKGSLTEIPHVSQARSDALIAAARKLDEMPHTRQELEAIERDAVAQHARKAKAERNGTADVIDAFNEDHDVEKLLLANGYSKGVGGRLCRPGRSGALTSISIREGRSCHWSSNDPLNDGKVKDGMGCHDAFDVFCHFEHKGDISASVRAAAELLGMAYPRKKRKKGRDDEAYSSSFVSFVDPTTGKHVYPWPKLEPAALHGLAGEAVRVILPHTEADPAALLFQILAAFGSAAGRNAHFEADGADHYLNLYLVLVGETAKGRKGTSWKNAAKIFREMDLDWLSNRVVSGLSSGEGLIWQVRDEVKKRVAVKVKGRYTGQYDEVVEHEAVADKRLLVMEGEFANVLKVMKREGNTLSTTIRLAWDDGDLKTLTKNSPAKATGAHVSIVGHVTKTELRRELDATDAANGFGNRFLWLCVDRSKCLPEGGQIPDLSGLAERMHAALANAKSASLITRDANARKLWAEVYPELSKGKRGMSGSLTSRAEAQVMRLACIYALLDLSRMVRVEHLDAALAAWRYCEASVYNTFGKSLGDPLADELYDALCKNPEGMSRTDISNHLGRNAEADKIARALNALVEAGKARREVQKTAGRPSERWFAATGDNELNEESPEADEAYAAAEREAVQSEGAQ